MNNLFIFLRLEEDKQIKYVYICTCLFFLRVSGAKLFYFISIRK